MRVELDLKIRGGRIVDGSGPRRSCRRTRRRGRSIVAVGAVADDPRIVIDASDQVVAPRFVDVHPQRHAADVGPAPSPLEGVETAVAGRGPLGT
jgi:N-acyl-D-aspartate/D-glutamate deacylase